MELSAIQAGGAVLDRVEQCFSSGLPEAHRTGRARTRTRSRGRSRSRAGRFSREQPPAAGGCVLLVQPAGRNTAARTAARLRTAPSRTSPAALCCSAPSSSAAPSSRSRRHSSISLSARRAGAAGAVVASAEVHAERAGQHHDWADEAQHLLVNASPPTAGVRGLYLFTSVCTHLRTINSTYYYRSL